MIAPKANTAFRAALLAALCGAVLAVPMAWIERRGPAHAAANDQPEDKRWLAVAPGRVEPSSGTIKLAAPVMGVISAVLVKANDTVFAGEPLIRLADVKPARSLPPPKPRSPCAAVCATKNPRHRAPPRGAVPRMQLPTPRPQCSR